QLKFHVRYRSTNRIGSVDQNRKFDGRRNGVLQLRKESRDAVYHLNDICSWLPLYVHNYGRGLIHPGSLPYVLYAIDDLRDILQHHGSAVPVSNDYLVVIVSG